MSSARGNSTVTGAGAGAGAAVPSGARAGEGGKETKVVETTDYRSSAGQAQEEKRPVQVVHENADGKSSAGSMKQD